MTETAELASVAIRVSDLDRSLLFWRDLAGLRVKFDTGWTEEAALFGPSGTADASAVRIVGLLDPRVPDDAPLGPQQPPCILLEQFTGIDTTPVRGRFQDPGTMHIALWVDDLDARVARFTEAGFPLLGPVGPAAVGGRRLAMIGDPDGFTIELLG